MVKRKFSFLPKVFRIILPIIIVALITIPLLVFNSKKDITQSLPTAQSVYDSCGKLEKGKETCYIKLFDDISKGHSLADTVTLLKDVQQFDTTVSFCHTIAHKISHNEVSKNPSDWLNLMSQVDPVICSNGFLHGVIEGHMQADPSFVIDENSMVDICREVERSFHPSVKEAFFRECIHMTSHLLLVQEEANVPKAISTCQKMKENNYECYFGVFMEDVQRENLQIHGYKSIEQTGFEDINYYATECNGYTGQAQEACWKSKGWVFYRIHRFDIDKMYESCSKASTTEGFLQCYTRGLGIMIAIDKTQKLNRLALIDYCNKVKGTEDYRKCTLTLIFFLLKVDDLFKQYSHSYCGIVRNELKNECKEFATNTINTFEERKKLTGGRNESIEEL